MKSFREYSHSNIMEQPISKHVDFERGRRDWQEYVNLNGYAFRPSKDGLKKLSQKTGRNIRDLRKSINAFLEA